MNYNQHDSYYPSQQQQSYQNQAPNDAYYNNANFYEYDESNANQNRPLQENFITNTSNKVKGLIGGLTGSTSQHSMHQYKRDIFDHFCTNINQTLLLPKTFYFFFFGAFGSLFPLLAIYFKQMAMTPMQVGILLGLRPFIEFISAPFWTHVGEQYRKGRLIFLVSLLSWIFFTLAMSFIKPPVHSCLMSQNDTHLIIQKPVGIKKRDLDDIFQDSILIGKRQSELNANNFIKINNSLYEIKTRTKIIRVTKTRKTTTSSPKTTELIEESDEIIEPTTTTTLKPKKSRKTTTPETSVKTSSEEIVLNAVNTIVSEVASQITESSSTTTAQTKKPINYFGADPLHKELPKLVNPKDSHKLVKPPLKTSIVYHKEDVQRVFYLFLFLLLVGEFFSAPAITYADTCTLQYLGPSRVDLYGRQRMFGSLGWAFAMFCVGFLLDRSQFFQNHPCGQNGPDERNYSVCFAIYTVLMGCAFMIGTQFKFTHAGNEQVPLKNIQKSQSFVAIDPNEPPQVPSTVYDTIDANEQRKLKFKKLLDTCKTLKNASFLFIIWYMGIGVGLVFTFLFWHLQDLGGSPALYGVASVINHLSELMAYFFAHEIIWKIGHVKVFYIGLFGNFLRFVYVSLLQDPNWILPFEFIQGITHALVWATATTYFSQRIPDDLKSIGQGILQGLHFGLGRGCGSVFGGMLVHSIGSKATFACYGILCLILMGAYMALNHFYQDSFESQAKNDFNFENDANLNEFVNANQVDNQKAETNQHASIDPFSLPNTSFPASNPNWSKEFSTRNY